VALFDKVLVANRGEIAIRVFRTLRELGIGTVGIYSEADRGSLHAAVADEAYLVGPGPAAESYLHVERILAAAARSGAAAIHPGYGFLAESPAFARAVKEAGLVWIGPPPDAIELMGSKIGARESMAEAGVPIIPGTTDPVESAADVVRLGEEYGWPVAIKASAGGGGKGLKVVSDPGEAERALAAARREGESYFRDATVYVEKFIDDPRHVEVQVLADDHNNVIHLGERDCTLQRRHQKIVEETPSPAVTPELRERIGRIAVEAARAVGYRSAGTIEGLLDCEGNYWFLEMNTRIQVEHTITELVTGVDLVREQVAIAAGRPTSVRQDELRFAGHAMECRINAEDPANAFLPSPGVITDYREPSGPGVRIDSGVTAGSEVVGLYDPLIAKLCAWDVDREHARLRMLRALDELVVDGVTTLVGFHRALLEHPCFVEATTCHGIVESEELAKRSGQLSHVTTTVARSPDGRFRERVVELELDGRHYDVKLLEPEPPHVELARRRRQRVGGAGHHAAAKEAVVSPMQGTVLAVEVAEGDEVSAGQVICVVEAMKMENEITAHRRGTVGELSVAAGEPVKTGQVICVVTQEGSGLEASL
jgi:acetyl-CoA/propionyl-CoA carboxylase biotin carboxyl carrier protein